MKPFPWRAGMRTTTGRRLTDHGEGSIPPLHATPDRTDPATLGALLGVVREVWGCPAAQVTPWTRWDPVGCAVVVMGWRCCLNDADDRCFPVGTGHAPTEFDALLAAYEAAPVAQ